MQHPMTSAAALVLAYLFLAGCGQKGPLFLPGDPSEVRQVPEQEEVEGEREEEEERRIRIQ